MFKAYYDRLCGFAWQYVDSAEVAEELVQSVFLKIWENRRDWDPSGTVRSYLYRAVRNQALNHLKHKHVERKWMQQIELDAEALRLSPEAELRYNELVALVRQAVNQLPKRRRLIFRLSRQHGLTYVEIASMLDISVKTVETQMGRALKTLRELLRVYLAH